MSEGLVNEGLCLFFNRPRFPTGAESKQAPSYQNNNFFSSRSLPMQRRIDGPRFISKRKSGVSVLVASGRRDYSNILVTPAIRK